MKKRPASEKLLKHLETVKGKTGRKKSPDDQITQASKYKRRWREQKKHQDQVRSNLNNQTGFRVMFNNLENQPWIDQDFATLEQVVDQQKAWTQTSGSLSTSSSGKKLIQIDHIFTNNINTCKITIYPHTGDQVILSWDYFINLSIDSLRDLLFGKAA